MENKDPLEFECVKCKATKPATEFYRNSRNKSGYTGFCKSCAYRNQHPEKVKAYMADYRRKNQEKLVLYAKNYKRGDPDSARKQREYANNNKNKIKAHRLVRAAIKDGSLLKPAICEKCGFDTRLYAHHDDYLKPLEIRWLCQPCHSSWHAKNGEGLNGGAKQ